MIELKVKRDLLWPESYFVVTENRIVARFRRTDSGYSVWMYKRHIKREFPGLRETLVFIENSFCQELARNEVYKREAV